MKKRRTRITLICFVSLMSFILIVPCSVNAATTVGEPFYGPDGNWWRYVTTKETKWTSYKYVAGQPIKGTYLKKGNSLYYNSSGGTYTTVSIAVGYGIGSISVSVPLGKKASAGVGTSLKAPSSGYYKIKAKKQITVTAKTSQWCQSVIGKNKPDGKWKNAYTNKSFTTVRIYPVLVKQ